MKRIALTLLALVALTACNSVRNPFSLGRIFPDGSSFEVSDAQLVVTGTGGTLSARSIRCIGTNGVQFTPATNATPTIAVPAGTLMQVR